MKIKKFVSMLLFCSSYICVGAINPSFADTFDRRAILACSKTSNQFVVRFGTIYNEDTIDKAELIKVSPQIEKMYKDFSSAEDRECQLSNGKKIEVTTYRYQAYAYGMGGADPDAAFILKIDDQPVYYKRKFYLGYGQEKFLLNGLFYDDGHLYEDVSNRLEDKHSRNENLSEEEGRELERDDRRKKLRENLSPFCKEILSTRENPHYSKTERVPSGFISHLDIDLNNDGKVDRVFRIGGGSADGGVGSGSHAFDGSFLIAFTNGNAREETFLKDIKNEKYELNLDLGWKRIMGIPEWDAILISQSYAGNTGRYIYNVPFNYQGTNYIYAFEVKEDAIPRRSVSKLSSDNKFLMPVCQYAD